MKKCKLNSLYLKLFFFVNVLFTGTQSFSQDIIPPIISPYDCISAVDIYNCTILNNNTSTNPNIFIQGEVFYGTSQNTLQLLASGQTSNFTLPTGALIINRFNSRTLLEPIESQILDNDFESLLFNTNCLSPGSYEICIRLIDFEIPMTSDGSYNVISSLCYNFEIQSATPLLLVSPFNDTKVDLAMPLFTWTPVLPSIDGGNYHISLFEILGHQSPFEAIRSQPIFFEERGIFTNIFQYPLATRQLEECRKYVWKVDYETNAGRIITSSEFFVFETVCNEKEKEASDEDEYIEEPVFHQLFTELKGDYISIKSPVLAFKIDNRYGSRKKVTYYLLNEKGEKEIPENGLSIYGNEKGKPLLQSGANFFLLNLEEAGLKSNQKYTLVLDGLKRRLYLRFYVKENQK